MAPAACPGTEGESLKPRDRPASFPRLFHTLRTQAQETYALPYLEPPWGDLGSDVGEEGSDEAAREQMRTVWKRLEEGVRRGTVQAGAVAVMKRYITAHWRTPAPEPPAL